MQFPPPLNSRGHEYLSNDSWHLLSGQKGLGQFATVKKNSHVHFLKITDLLTWKISCLLHGKVFTFTQLYSSSLPTKKDPIFMKDMSFFFFASPLPQVKEYFQSRQLTVLRF